MIVLHRYWTDANCVRHWRDYVVPHWMAPERIASAVACVRSALPLIAALPLVPLAPMPPAPPYVPAPFVAPYGLPAYGLGDFVFPGGGGEGFAAGGFGASGALPGVETAGGGASSQAPVNTSLAPEVLPAVGGEVGTGATESGGQFALTLPLSTPVLTPVLASVAFAPGNGAAPVGEPPALWSMAVSLVIVGVAGLWGRG